MARARHGRRPQATGAPWAMPATRPRPCHPPPPPSGSPRPPASRREGGAAVEERIIHILIHQNAWGRCIIVTKHLWGTLGCVGGGFRAGGNTVFAVKIHQTFLKGKVFPRNRCTRSPWTTRALARVAEHMAHATCAAAPLRVRHAQALGLRRGAAVIRPIWASIGGGEDDRQACCVSMPRSPP